MLTTNVPDGNGSFIILNDMEEAVCERNQRQANEMTNALGFEIPITTLTAIQKRVVEQKFFEIAPADYMPVRVGNGAWSSNLLTYLQFDIAGDFETGKLNTGAENARLANADTGVDSLSIKVNNWAKQITWNLFDIRQAAVAGNWDLISAKERARKRNWDLGIQYIAFLGEKGNTNVKGLLTQSTVNSNLTVITKYINVMTSAEFATFVAAVLEAYRANAARTAKPTHFIMPEADFNGLTTPVASGFPNISKLDYLTMAFKTATMNPNFKILPCAYCDVANNAASINKNRYVLLNYDEDTIRMDIPVDYSNTLQNTVNGFSFQNVGYGQYTGVLAYRPLEILYFDF